jgi:hypothetical protein
MPSTEALQNILTQRKIIKTTQKYAFIVFEIAQQKKDSIFWKKG